MKYRNVKTGVVIEAPSVLGGPWERIDSDKAPAKEPVVDAPAVEEEIKPAKKTTRKSKK